MKIRKGFVSNSSSSSFVCDVCGEEASGMDMSLCEADMVCCVNGHIFCESHLLGENTLDILQDEDREDYDEEWIFEVPTEFCPICQFETVMDSDMAKYLMKRVNRTPKEIREEIKTIFNDYNQFSEYLKS